MTNTVISVENLSKTYRLGQIGTGTLSRDLEAWWAKMRGKPNPLLKIGQSDHGNRDGEEIWALKDVSFTVQQAEAMGIIGRNGAGKSTLLKLLSRVTAPTSGKIKVKGRVASLLEVGTGFHPELTGRENIYLNGAILGMTKDDVRRKFDEIVDFSGVEMFIDTPVKRYSSGMYVRLAFAVAAHLDTEILIVDEVLAVGDAEFQKKCLGKMGGSALEGRTVLFVSHNMGAVQRLCTRTVLLSQGEVIKDGITSAVIDHYLESGLSQQGERLWSELDQAPGDEVVRLKAVRAINRHNVVSSNFSVREPVCLEVEFNVLTGGFPLDVGFSLYDIFGNLIFITIDTSTIEWQGRPRPAGVYRERCEVPGDFLNEGSIRIMAAIATNPGSLHAIEKDALQIKIVDNLESVGGARGNYTREWVGGSVRPLLHWSTTHIPGIPAR
jgi:lipopolysaccharide transport system ATP-binding protein